MTEPKPDPPCRRCGHPRAAHEHHSGLTHCVLCDVCVRYGRPWPWQRRKGRSDGR